MPKKAKNKPGSAPEASTSNGTNKDAGKGKNAPAPATETAPAAPPKPTVKQIIGGSSWTGKLPVNLLSEHCQKQKWQSPAYDTKKTPDGFSVWITLSAKDPKTQQITKLEPFKIPASHRSLVTRDTALEAKHAAATYTLFRVCSMQNIHTVLPPDYKSLWKEFQALKAEDLKEEKSSKLKNGKSLDPKDSKAWMYDADPFKALQEREEAKAAADKKRKEFETAKAKAAAMPGSTGLALLGNAANESARGFNPLKGWATAPKAEMGRHMRSRLESLLRNGVSWNPRGVVMSQEQRQAIIAEFGKLGFRHNHIVEATELCKDREESLEWLLMHVPEDDLPNWALPEGYAAGVSLGATDLKREGIVKRLTQTGYSMELAVRTLNDVGGNEIKAAQALQGLLLAGLETPPSADTAPAFLDMGTPEELWEEEVESLQAIYGDKFFQEKPGHIRIQLDPIKNTRNGSKGSADVSLQVVRPESYPRNLLLSIAASLPSYIKLSLLKKALEYVEESIADEPMKIFLVADWINQHLESIIENPGRLVDISAVASAASEKRPQMAAHRRPGRQERRKQTAWIFDQRSKDEWLKRQARPEMEKMIAQRQRLPAWQLREDIIETVEDNHVTIISGETGSGKSTQSVQFVLDDLYGRGLGDCANMIVTQPRRISALGLADRVADERCSNVGGEVGYTIRGESRRSQATRITFVTIGVLLRRLQTSGGRIEDVRASLADVSHVVIDEVHERSLDTDFLLNLIREVLGSKKDLLKLVLMSATLDAASFKDYFGKVGLSVGIVEISGRTYPVDEYYLDDVVRMTGYGAERTGADFIDDESMGKIIQKLGYRINYNLLLEAVRAIDYELDYEKKSGGILIFLPGVGEINQACAALRAMSSLHVLPLHASLETREQKRVFSHPPPGKRKVVVATNVAETSITIDDIVVVIDSGKVKETKFDPQNNMRKLEEGWASLAACKQRRGRAGRVMQGTCYKLFTRNVEMQMAERPEPEIRRVPLEQLCLSVRAMGIDDIGRFLGRSPTPPEAVAIEGAVKLLQRIGAFDGSELTAMGQQLAMLPTDLRCGKLMVFGSIFGCLDDCVTIAAILSTKSPFFSPQDKKDEARRARMTFSSGEGDLLTDLEAFKAWVQKKRDGVAPRAIRSFCDDNFLSFQVMGDISNTKGQFYSALAEAGIVPPRTAAHEHHDAIGAMGAATTSTTTPSNPQLLRTLIASAFTPQIARIQYPDKKFASSVSGAVELDPEARSIKYFNQENGRVFVHPSSTLFDNQSFSGHAAFLSYFSLISTSKIFVRDLTPFNVYTLLLFCGPIELDTLGRGLLLDGWLRIRGWARIGVLLARLRDMVDDLIAERVQQPDLEVQGNEVIEVVTRLIELDGLDA